MRSSEVQRTLPIPGRLASDYASGKSLPSPCGQIRSSPVKRRRIAGQPVMLHYRDVPDSDITTRDGIRLTTTLRTIIDLP